MIPVRQQIVNALIARMEQILTTNDYQTNIGQNVRDWETNWSDDELPALSVCDLVSQDTVSQPDSVIQFVELPIMFRIFSKRTTAADLRLMIADICKAISVDKRIIVDNKSLAMWIVLDKHGIMFEPDSFTVSGAAVEVTVRYSTKTFNLFEQ